MHNSKNECPEGSFSQAVIETLGNYVYGLKDPNSNKPLDFFYIGKGVGNRAFAHLIEARENNKKTEKLNTIRGIYRQGKEPQIVIIKFGLSKSEAFILESTLISLLGIADLTNKVSGHGGEKNLWRPIELETEFGAKEAKIDFPCILIKVNKAFELYCKENKRQRACFTP